MRVGFVGLGKLGLPVAVSMALKDHDVMGYDIDPGRMTYAPQTYHEAGPDGKGNFNGYLAKSTLRFGTLRDVAEHAEILFLAIQTPHHPAYEGTTRLSAVPADFDYSYLKQAVKSLAEVIARDTPVIIISTVLPGTIRREILPLCSRYMKVCYNPFFIAMGTVMRDFLHPEFILFGVHDPNAVRVAHDLYETITDAPIFATTIETAELIKVTYNTYISQKLAFINTVMEIAHKIPGANVDDVSRALSLATDRLISQKYLSGGMGDGGGCHPRDGIAMSYLADRLNLSHNIFEDIMLAREDQTAWIADLAIEQYTDSGMPIGILGYAFKAGTNISTGSPALLLANILRERVWQDHMVTLHDPYIDADFVLPEHQPPRIWIIGCKHPEFQHYRFPRGSVVIDPWRYIPYPQTGQGVEVVRLGVGVERAA